MSRCCLLVLTNYWWHLPLPGIRCQLNRPPARNPLPALTPHTPAPASSVSQPPHADHSYWGRPEEQTGPRPAYTWSPGKPASDAAGAAASALASAAVLFRASDPAYAARCLGHARGLFAFASKVRRVLEIGIGEFGD